MKYKTLIALACLISSPALAAEETHFTCVNQMFREAAMNFTNASVSIKDSYPVQTDRIAEILSRQLGLKGQLLLNSVKLNVYRGETFRCSSSLPFLLSCEGSTTSADLTVHGILTGGKDGATITLNVGVEVPSMKIESSLQSPGSVPLSGSGPTSVTLNKMVVKGQSTIIIGGETVNLEWDTFFRTLNDNSASHCEVL